MTAYQSTNDDDHPVWVGKKLEELPKKVLPPLPIPSQEQSHSRSLWRHVLNRLTRTTVQGNVQPRIGQMCIIMTGIAGQDEGQMGVVTQHTKVMVEVTFAAKSGKGTITKTKQARSLVLLEPGLVMVQDANGSVWVRSVSQDGPRDK